MKLFARGALALLYCCAPVALFASDEPDFSELDAIFGPENPVVEAAPDAAADPSDGPADDPFAGLPENIRSILQKFDKYRDGLRAKLLSDIAEGRKIAVEILTAQAGKADPAAGAALLKEAKRLESLEPSQPLLENPPDKNSKSPPIQKAVLGTWYWTPQTKPYKFLQDGTVLGQSGKLSSHWRWLDEARGIFFLNWKGNGLALFQMQSPVKCAGVNLQGKRFPIDKTKLGSPPPVTGLANNDPVMKLAASELESRRAAEKRIHDMADKIAQWMKSQSASLSAAQAKAVLNQQASIDPNSAKSGAAPMTGGLIPTDILRGEWVSDGKRFEFADGGVVKLNGQPSGKWMWVKSEKQLVFTLSAAAPPAIGRISTSKEGVLRIDALTGKMSDAKKQPPKK